MMLSDGKSVPSISRRLVDIARLTRAEQWWSYKLSPMLAIYYATLLRCGSGIVDAGWRWLPLVAGVAACAVYVSLSNDLADRQDDRVAGKPNRLEGKSAAFVIAALGAPIALGVVVAWFWRSNLILLLAFAGSWICFSAYSFAPLRLKARGVWGVAADAAGAHGFPALLAVLLAYDAAGQAPNLIWCICIVGWSGAFGLRGILWHQLLDSAADQKSATATFVQRHGAGITRAIVQRLLFPSEFLLLLASLWLVPGRFSMCALALYAFYLLAKVIRFDVRPTLVTSIPRYVLVLVEFYVVIWPLALLSESAWLHPLDIAVLALHATLFHGPIHDVVQDLRQLAPRLF